MFGVALTASSHHRYVWYRSLGCSCGQLTTSIWGCKARGSPILDTKVWIMSASSDRERADGGRAQLTHLNIGVRSDGVASRARRCNAVRYLEGIAIRFGEARSKSIAEEMLM